ncbi:MAG TPA: hypothetical protein VM864_07810 [Pyrinomonadaceae bacterium]|jgi:hypothetical protein|nr:hypothetical protein [Pyrinomonadaceae bacterium]
MTKGRDTSGRKTRAQDAAGRDAADRVTERREANRLLTVHLLLPTIFLTVALAGGVRIEGATRALVFVAPPLVTLLLAVLLLALFARGRLVRLGGWLSHDNAPLANASHALTLLSLFFASAQAFNSVLPDAGLFRWLFSFFFLWTLWQNQFAALDAPRTLRAVAALLGTAFVLKHLLLAGLYAPEGGWLRRVAGALVEGVTQGSLGEQPTVAPATGYVSFFTLALYVVGLILLPRAPDEGLAGATRAVGVVEDYGRLPALEREEARAEISREELRRLEAGVRETRRTDEQIAPGDD